MSNNHLTDAHMLAYFRRSAYGRFLRQYVNAHIEKACRDLLADGSTPGNAAYARALREVAALVFDDDYKGAA